MWADGGGGGGGSIDAMEEVKEQRFVRSLSERLRRYSGRSDRIERMWMRLRQVKLQGKIPESRSNKVN